MGNKERALVTITLMLVIFLDTVGQGILFPLLGKTLIPLDAHLFTKTTSGYIRTMLYSGVLALFYLFWFFGSVLMGNISDGSGRKKALLICLTGTGLSYLISVFAFMWGNIWLLCIGRIVGGITAGCQPIAMAGIIDISTPEKKQRNLSFILVAAILGIIAGPLLGSLLTDSNLVSWFNDTVPMYFGFILSCLLFLLIVFFLKRAENQNKKVNLNPLQAASLLIEACKHKQIRHLSILYFFCQIGWTGFFTYAAVFLIKTYNYHANNVGFFVALMGAGLGFGFIALNPFLKKASSKLVISSGFTTIAAVLLVITFIHIEWLLWVLIFIGTAGVAISVSRIIVCFSGAVSPERQGWAMGIHVSVNVLAGLVALISNTFTSGLGVNIPMYIFVVTIAIGVITTLFFNEEQQEKPAT